MALSKQRSLTAYRYLIDNYGIDKNRIYAYGVGNEEPPVRIAGEKSRAYNARWPRVEIRLVEGE
jgi:outer membrane protein OmpA-like peptidoglycan-associated protein